VVEDVVPWNSDNGHWDLTFARSPNDLKEDNICTLLALLANREDLPHSNDEIVWPHDSKLSFTVKSFCTTQFETLSGLDFLPST